MDKNLKQELLEEIEEFQVQTNRFLQKELSVKEFKGYSGGFGSYAQSTEFYASSSYESGSHHKRSIKIYL